MKQQKEFNVIAGTFLIAYQTLLVAYLPFYFFYSPPGKDVVLATIVLMFLTGLSITAGYHRYFSHRSYKTHPVIEYILLFFGSMTIQGSALRWSFDHRKHHAFVDTDRDPYSIKRGFWHAHFLWLLEKQEPIDPKVVADLKNNPRVMFQERHDILCMLGSNMLVWLFFGYIFDDMLGALVMIVGLRIFLVHHFTWFINSLAHTWGDRPFDIEQSAVNNFILSFLTFGEGYHNYHHTFAHDYRNGVRWYHFDPTKWLIWVLNKAGLATNLRKVDALTIQKKMVIERRQILLERIKTTWYVKKDELEHSVQEISDRIVENMVKLHNLNMRYHQFRKEKAENALVEKLRHEMEQLKDNFHSDWKKWKELSSSIMKLQPVPSS
ncbi:MAG: fatty acid desaturase [Chlamydiales bacterium]|nr:fatty acid desaturase [Chlamydiia bacterium]MCP5507251.1 fatty acid desaturase [Chlamydiales bacterium]